MKFKKFLIWAVILGLLGWRGYIVYQDYLAEQQVKAWEESFVARQVSPYQENNEGIYYYYKSIGGEQYFADECYVAYASDGKKPFPRYAERHRYHRTGIL